MVSNATLRGRWNEVRGQLKEKWGQLTDNDLQTVEGQAEQLVGLIQRKTGEARESIERWLDQTVRGSSSSSGKQPAGTQGKGSTDSESESTHGEENPDATNRVGEYVHQSVQRAGEVAHEQYSQAKAMVQDKPMQSVGVAFVAGLVTGVLFGLLLTPRQESRSPWDPRYYWNSGS